MLSAKTAAILSRGRWVKFFLVEKKNLHILVNTIATYDLEIHWTRESIAMLSTYFAWTSPLLT